MFAEQDYPYRVLGPQEVVLANPVLVGEQEDDDISASWYLIAADPDMQYLTVDLDPKRLGRCYDSFIGHHANPGYCPIIALSFSDLLERLLDNRGDYPFWLKEDFISLGDAYDEI